MSFMAASGEVSLDSLLKNNLFYFVEFYLH